MHLNCYYVCFLAMMLMSTLTLQRRRKFWKSEEANNNTYKVLLLIRSKSKGRAKLPPLAFLLPPALQRKAMKANICRKHPWNFIILLIQSFFSSSTLGYISRSLHHKRFWQKNSSSYKITNCRLFIATTLIVEIELNKCAHSGIFTKISSYFRVKIAAGFHFHISSFFNRFRFDFTKSWRNKFVINTYMHLFSVYWQINSKENYLAWYTAI